MAWCLPGFVVVLLCLCVAWLVCVCFSVTCGLRIALILFILIRVGLVVCGCA